MRKATLLILSIIFSGNVLAFKDTLILAEMAATLAKDLQHTLRILEIAEDQQKKLNDVYTNITHRRMLASRVIRKMEYAKSLGNTQIHDLRSFNRALAELKYQYQDSERLLAQIGNALLLDEIALSRIEISKEQAELERGDINLMRSQSFTGGFEDSAKHTAINTAVISETLNEQRRDNLEFQSRVLEDLKMQRERDYVSQKEKEELREFYGTSFDAKFWEERR